MQPHPIYSICYFTYKIMNILYNTHQVKKWSLQTGRVDFPPTRKISNRTPPTHTSHLLFRQKTKQHKGVIERNPIHTTIYHLTLNGCPAHSIQVLRVAWHFWWTRDEVSVDNGILLQRMRICIPPELHDKTLPQIHEEHLGIEKMQQIAQATVYWPSRDADIHII